MNRTEIATLGEFGLIDHLTSNIKIKRDETILGIGDDCAIIQHDGFETLVSTDVMVEGIHFDPTYTSMHYLGFKAIATNVSDICAMNGQATHILLSLSISSRYSVEALEELYKGIDEACNLYNVDFIGGDTVSSLKGLVINVTVLGKAEKGKAVRRNTAAVGDLICVSGDLGAAFVGLQLLEREKAVLASNPELTADFEKHQYILQRQLKPSARVDVISFLKSKNIIPTSMIDVSDGISSDLLHICTKSKVGCELLESEIPIDNETSTMALSFNIDPLTCALNGGEDYELLFTIHPKDEDVIKDSGGISIIGEIVHEEMGYKLRSRSEKLHNLTAQGWNHYK